MAQCIRCSAFLKVTKRKHNLCLSCKREYDKAWRISRKESGNPIKSIQLPREWHKKYEEQYYADPIVRKHRSDLMKKYANDPAKRYKFESRYATNRAIKRGLLKKQDCECCGIINVQAHHDDYSKPLEIRWLCRDCHKNYHKKLKAEGKS